MVYIIVVIVWGALKESLSSFYATVILLIIDIAAVSVSYLLSSAMLKWQQKGAGNLLI